MPLRIKLPESIVITKPKAVINAEVKIPQNGPKISSHEEKKSQAVVKSRAATPTLPQDATIIKTCDSPEQERTHEKERTPKKECKQKKTKIKKKISTKTS